MANKRFDADMADITTLAIKLLGIKADGTIGSVLFSYQKSIGTHTVEGDNPAVIVKGNKIGGNRWLLQTVDSNGRFRITNDVFGDAITILENGNTGFKNTNPTEALHVSGNILASGSITPASDKRLKKNIKNLPNALSAILELRPVTYTRKSDGVNDIGLIADEVREFFPDLVIEGKGEDKMLSLDYMKLTSPIISAIQALNSKVDELAKQNAELLARIEALEK